MARRQGSVCGRLWTWTPGLLMLITLGSQQGSGQGQGRNTHVFRLRKLGVITTLWWMCRHFGFLFLIVCCNLFLRFVVVLSELVNKLYGSWMWVFVPNLNLAFWEDVYFDLVSFGAADHGFVCFEAVDTG